jgi:hypothetical protein
MKYLNNNYVIHALLCVCSFAFMYALLYFISGDLFWVNGMLDSERGRVSLLAITLLTIAMSIILSSLVKVSKQNT